MGIREKIKRVLGERTEEILFGLYRQYFKETFKECLIFKIKLFIRQKFDSPDRKKIESYRNRATGRRCFLIGTGPSLNIKDLEKLRGEDCFSCNAIPLSFDKTDWRPMYYFILDSNAYEALKSKIKKCDYDTIFYSEDLKKFSEDGAKMLVDYRQHFKRRHNITPSYSVSNDVSLSVADGNTVIYAMIQYAIYMGYKDIYLLGVDCNYKVGEENHFTTYKTKFHGLPTDALAMIQSFRELYSYIKKKNFDVEIYNATRGGMLEVFPRVEFDTLFK